MPLVWDVAIYGTGVKELDEQHQELFRRVNRLLDAAMVEGSDPELPALMSFLDDYVREHFACEERIMEARRCASCGRNREAHQMFLRDFGEVKRRFQSEGVSQEVVADLQDLVVGWMSNHIANIDTELRKT